MRSKRLPSIAIVAVLLCSSIALGATATSAHEPPSAAASLDAPDRPYSADRPSAADQIHVEDRPRPADRPSTVGTDADATEQQNADAAERQNANADAAERQNATDRSRAAYPAGYAADRVDAASAIAQHHRAVTASDSVHTEIAYEATANGGASVHVVEAWTNFSQDAQYLSAQGVYSAAERYVEDGVRYTNTSVSYGDNASYERTRGPLLTNRSTGRDVLAKFLPYVEFAHQETTTVDGQQRFTYEATGFDADSFSIYMRDVAEIRSVNATLVVDEQGRIHEFTFTLDAVGDDGNPLTVELSLELDGFGDTSVQQPGWVGEEFDEDEVEYGNQTWI